jgi:hypothetical protein
MSDTVHATVEYTKGASEKAAATAQQYLPDRIYQGLVTGVEYGKTGVEYGKQGVQQARELPGQISKRLWTGVDGILKSVWWSKADTVTTA